jgi:hypothetical protein
MAVLQSTSALWGFGGLSLAEERSIHRTRGKRRSTTIRIRTTKDIEYFREVNRHVEDKTAAVDRRQT